MAAPIPDLVYDFYDNDEGIAYCFPGSKYDPELREVENFFRIDDSENNQNFYERNLLQRTGTELSQKQNRRLSY